MVGLCLAMLAACFDGTIVGTIGTFISKDLGGMDLYAWMATAYLLCETVMIPISGKLSDMYGRKPLFLIGLVIFTAGSVLAGMSQSMIWFICCRGIQGIGGGILIPVVTAAIADLYAPHERARMQGLLGAIFGIGSGIGPLLGGYIEGALSWHWCFYINLPFAIVSFLLTMKKFPTPESSGEKHIDTKGIAILSLFLLDIILLLEFGGDKFEWASIETGAMVAAAAALIIVFVMIERRAVDPVLAPHLIHNKTVIMAAIFMFIFGIGMMGAMMYTNMFAVVIMGLTAIEAGEWSLALIAGMMITALTSGALVHKTGYKAWLIAGPIICFIGMYILSGMTVTPGMVVDTTMTGGSLADTFVTRYLAGTFVFGVGLGCMMSVIMAAVQNSSKPTEMGMTTSSVNLIRAIGTTMGTAIFAMIINSKMATELTSAGIPEWLPHSTKILNEEFLGNPEVMRFIPDILSSFANSVDYSFLLGGLIILILVIVGIVFKADKPPVDEEFQAAVEKIENGEE